jgi:hypothetical protein
LDGIFAPARGLRGYFRQSSSIDKEPLVKRERILQVKISNVFEVAFFDESLKFFAISIQHGVSFV